MQFSVASLLAVLAASAVAAPNAIPNAEVEKRTDLPICPTGLFNVPQCCDADILGVADFGCVPPTTQPTSAKNFAEICAARGKISTCCTLPLLGQGVLCTRVYS